MQKDRIINRFKELDIEPDPERLEHELVYLAQKADIAEELNREANTLGSKSISKITTAAAVELKVIIEQMREQVQNLE